MTDEVELLRARKKRKEEERERKDLAVRAV